MRAWTSTALAIVAALMFAPAAFADVSDSTNWAGYAVHRSGISFRRVSASWRQPVASCTPGQAAFSAYWVGIGGFSPTSGALEQTGTEADCNGSGKPVLSAWYELEPAPSTPTSLRIRPGDDMAASVTVIGHQVTVSLYDATRHQGFTKTLHASRVDASSAEWIVEAPSECATITNCQTMPLADFGTASFSSAQAEGSRGHVGSISSRRWKSTKIALMPDTQRFAGNQGNGAGAGAANPSALRTGGRAFTVTFARAAIMGNLLMAPRMAGAALSGHLFH